MTDIEGVPSDDIHTQRRNSGRLREFDPSSLDWEEWEFLLDTVFTVEGITDGDKKRNLLITALGVKPFKTLMALCKPKRPNEYSYEEILAKLRTNYGRITFASTERIKFFSMKQTSAQTLTDFANQLRDATTTCVFPQDFYEDALITAFVGGLSQTAVRKHLMQQDLKTFEQTLNSANTIHSVLVQGSNVANEATEDLMINKVQKQNSNEERKSSTYSCGSCGSTSHQRMDCKFKDAVCYKCTKKGHISKVCRSSSNKNSYNVNTVVATTFTDVASESPITITLLVEGVQVKFELDTGSPITIINSDTWTELGKPSVNITKTKYHSFTGHPIKFRGETIVKISCYDKMLELKTLITYNNQANILGRDWLKHLKLMEGNIIDLNGHHRIASVNQSISNIPELCNEYKEIFEEKLGCCKIEAHIYLKPNATEKFFKPRSIPFAYRQSVEENLQRLIQQNIIEPVNFSKWAAPIVVVPKPGGKVRICADFSVGVNQAIDVDQYPLPKPNDLFAVLNGGILFSKLDLSEAYLQVPVDTISKELLVINTHKGLFRYNRLPFGIASAPSIFQKIIDQMLAGLEDTVAYLDDIIITGKTEIEHLFNLKKVFQRLQEYGFKINQNKCLFMQPQVEYLGFIVDKNGVHTSQSKIQAIVEMPRPTNISQLRSFLGMVNHYAKFVQNLAAELFPFYGLLKKGVKWFWNLNCDKAFAKIKQILSSPLTLTHYNPKEKLILATDASNLGLGAVIYHRFSNGIEKPIAYASKTLSKTESGYAQIEKEALAIMFGLQKFDQFLRGRHFILLTDHKPLITIFGPKHGIPTTSANRLQRWAIKLMAYSYEIEYCSTKNFGQADGLSRLPIGPDQQFDDESLGDSHLIAAIQREHQEELPIRAKQIAKATRTDKILSMIYQYTQTGWPEKYNEQCQPYVRIRNELSISHGCILWGVRTIIPSCFRTRLLNHLHITHSGMARMKAEARQYFWWPRVDTDIENIARDCRVCTENSKASIKVPMHQWSTPEFPWQRIHIDFMGKFMNKFFLVVVDAYSKWLEVITMNNITASITIDALSSLFARYGLCQVIVSDNGTQFTSDEFQSFCSQNGIEHIRTAPAHPQSNGQAERYVESVKSALTKIVHDGESITQALIKFLFNYRTTPHSTTGSTPAELFLKRPLRTVLDLLRPTYTEATNSARTRYQSNFDRRTKEQHFSIGDKVLVRDFRSSLGKCRWIAGVLLQRQGSRLWLVKVEDKTWRRHEDQIKPRTWVDENVNNENLIFSHENCQQNTTEADNETSLSTSMSTSTPTATPTTTPSSTSSESVVESPVLRRSSRDRKPVRRYIEEI